MKNKKCFLNILIAAINASDASTKTAAYDLNPSKLEAKSIEISIPKNEFMIMGNIKSALKSFGKFEMKGYQILRVKGKNDEKIVYI